MGKRSRVFVIQDMGFSYGDAAHFGELIFLLQRQEGNVFNMRRVSSLLKKRLWDHNFRQGDYLLAVGAPALIMAAGIIAAELSPVLQVLQFDKKDQKYYSVEIRRN